MGSLYASEIPSECAKCSESIWSYCHSEAGSIRAYAWTTIGPDSADDPRYGVRCSTFGPHVPVVVGFNDDSEEEF